MIFAWLAIAGPGSVSLDHFVLKATPTDIQLRCQIHHPGRVRPASPGLGRDAVEGNILVDADVGRQPQHALGDDIA